VEDHRVKEKKLLAKDAQTQKNYIIQSWVTQTIILFVAFALTQYQK
jgi:hypothetical protein